MGIPHLSHQLQPHGVKVVLSRTTTTDSAGQFSTIIDGPSLAYHCFHACMSRRSGARNAYEAAPSYRELGEAAVAWLEQIEHYGLRVYVSTELPVPVGPVLQLSRTGMFKSK